MANIKDVAKRANVSVATVSRVINNKGYVNEHTRGLVEEAIKELNYVPNEVARSLFRKSSKTIAIMLYDLQNEFFNEVIAKVEEIAFKEGYQTMICTVKGDPKRETTYMKMFQTNQIAGLILCTELSKEAINHSPKIPVVSLERLIKNSIPSISFDNALGGRLAAEKLMELNSSYVLHVRGKEGLQLSDERAEGFMSVLQESSHVQSHHLEVDFYTFTKQEIFDFLKNHPKTDAVFAASDTIAATVIKCLKELKRKVPEKVKVIGYDNAKLTEIIEPTLSTIAQPTGEMSQVAMDTLLKLLNKEEVPNPHQVIPVHLIERETTAVK